MNRTACRRGFTLIELSIVLVIVGLVIGGVLVGRDLIHAAQIRAQVSQIEKYNAAINTFRAKYGGIPGDLRSDQAAAVGMVARGGGSGNGDGNGIIESCGPSYALFGCESIFFWSDLSFAQLVDGSFTSAANAFVGPVTTAQQSLYFPPAKLGNNSAILAINSPGGVNTLINMNIFAIVSNVTIGATGLYTHTGPSFTPAEAYAIDSKMDDGVPGSGSVQGGYAGNIFPIVYTTIVGANQCDTSPTTYNLNSTYTDTVICELNFRMQ